MGSNYEDILKNFGTGSSGTSSYSRAGSYGGSGYSYGTTTGGASYGTSGGRSYGTASSTAGSGGRTYVRVSSTTGGYGGYGGTFSGCGTVIGGEEEATKENLRNRWANRF